MMIQNEAEMYNLGLVGNARYCNGHMQLAVGMAPKKDLKNRKGKMVPSKDDIPSPTAPTVDGKLKFSDKLKALLKSGGTMAIKEECDPEDPYAFSEPEPQVLRLYQKPNTNNTYSKKCAALTTKLNQSNSKCAKVPVNDEGETNGRNDVANPIRVYPASPKSATQPVVVESIVKVENKVSDDESSKTMNRLQAKIAQNKVIGKHRKARPSSPGSKRERSLLEEQLLGLGAEEKEVIVKQEPLSPSCRPLLIPGKRRRSRVTPSTPQHETLQRIRDVRDSIREFRRDLYPLGVDVSESEESDVDEEGDVFQRHWYSACGEGESRGEGQRIGRLVQLRSELRRRLGQICGGVPSPGNTQLTRALLDSARLHPSRTAMMLQEHHQQSPPTHNRSKLTMLVKRMCSYRKGESDACSSRALPCTQHCVRHIMYNVDQLLFEHCTAKFSDNTQCCVPVFDICHELPLCLEHARKRDNYDRMCAETKPKKVRKKAKPSAMTRPSKRGKKKRKIQRLSQQPEAVETNGGENSPSPSEGFEPYIKEEIIEHSVTPEPQVLIDHEQPAMQMQEVVLEELPLDPTELAQQASRLLEEHDLTNVLNQIPADALNDLFTEVKNGGYEPTREETEELERALEAVDKDVKSLEKLSQTQGLLGSLMDDHSLAHTLAVMPEVQGMPVFTGFHHNGFVVSPAVSAPPAPAPTEAKQPSELPPPVAISIQTQTDTPS